MFLSANAFVDCGAAAEVNLKTCYTIVAVETNTNPQECQWWEEA